LSLSTAVVEVLAETVVADAATNTIHIHRICKLHADPTAT
jgi:hypothetical protein